MGDVVMMKPKKEVNVIRDIMGRFVADCPEEVLESIKCVKVTVYPDRGEYEILLDGDVKEEFVLTADELLEIASSFPALTTEDED